MRSRCVMKDFADDSERRCFAPTPSPLSVRRLLFGTISVWKTKDLVCALMQASTSCEMFARPPKGQEREGWIWRLHGAINGMRTASRDFTEYLAGALTECMGFTRGKLERCPVVPESNETRVVSHVHDPLTVQHLELWTDSGFKLRSWCISRGVRHSVLAYLWCAWGFRYCPYSRIRT